MEKRRPSIVDTITPLQAQAWQHENTALRYKREGSDIGALLLRQEAQEIRRLDVHQKIQRLFERSDAQNAVIETGLKLATEGRKVPVLAGASHTMKPDVSYRP